MTSTDPRGCLAINGVVEFGSGDEAVAAQIRRLFASAENVFESLVDRGRRDAGHLARTIEYVEFADQLLSADPRPSLAEYVARMTEAHPTRANVTTVIFGGVIQGLT